MLQTYIDDYGTDELLHVHSVLHVQASQQLIDIMCTVLITPMHVLVLSTPLLTMAAHDIT